MLLAHVSDLHFGAEDPVVVEALLSDLAVLGPDAIAASGDLTQRAQPGEFARARAFLDALPSPAIAVAGNHDVPVYEVVERFLDPYRRYRRRLSANLQPRLRTKGLALLGLNTARADVWKSGRLNHGQLETVERTLGTAPPGSLRVLVTHHPFIAPPEQPGAAVVGRLDLATEALERAHVDLLLSGHRHVRHSHVLDVGPTEASASVLVVLAGTACSHRHRGERNSYNVIEGDPKRLRIAIREWDGTAFWEASARVYRRDGRIWLQETGEATRA